MRVARIGLRQSSAASLPATIANGALACHLRPSMRKGCLLMSCSLQACAAGGSGSLQGRHAAGLWHEWRSCVGLLVCVGTGLFKANRPAKDEAHDVLAFCIDGGDAALQPACLLLRDCLTTWRQPPQVSSRVSPGTAS
jgi:hypothetical protein